MSEQEQVGLLEPIYFTTTELLRIITEQSADKKELGDWVLLLAKHAELLGNSEIYGAALTFLASKNLKSFFAETEQAPATPKTGARTALEVAQGQAASHRLSLANPQFALNPNGLAIHLDGAWCKLDGSPFIDAKPFDAARENPLRAQALALYKPPFTHKFGNISDADSHLIADTGTSDSEQVDLIVRTRGWGRLSKLPNSEQFQDEISAIICDALNEYWAKSTKERCNGI